jgi:serine/threonine protein kinase/Tfp pilus assembly protein PilF
MQCPQCRSDNPADTSFCGRCGSPLNASADTPFSFTKTIQKKVIGFATGSLIAGKYEIIEELGRGGMGVVYKAEDAKLKRTIALKFLSSVLLGEPGHQARFLREAQTASALNHPHICTIYEIGEEGGTPYIAMEYVAGLSLSEITHFESMPLKDVVQYGAQIAGALQYAHEHGIIHRDLKTANVIITPERGAKILDFGLAKRLENTRPGEAVPSQESLTEAGSFLGTMYYSAPEVFRDKAADARSDIWSLGVMLYEMTSGKLPFEGRTAFELTSAILRDKPVLLPSRVPDGLRAIIMKCLEKDPESRFQQASEIRVALEALAADGVAGLAVPVSRGRRRLRNGILFGAALIAALVLISNFIFKQSLPQKRREGQATVSTGGRASPIPEANEYFEKAMMFVIHQFDLQRARKMLERALEDDPKFAEARAWYGFTFVLEIDSGYSNDSSFLYKAEEELRSALESDPDTARAHSSLAALYLYQGRKEMVRQEAEKALQINPREMDSKILLGNYYRVNGDTASARTLFNQLLEQDPLFFPARMSLADILRTEGDYPAAIREYEKILEQDPQNIYAIQKMARVFIDAKDLRRARLRLEGLPAGNRQSYDVNMTWALLLALEAKNNEALKKMDAESLKYAALAVWSTLTPAEFYAVQGEPQQALDWLEKAVRNGDERDGWFRRDPLLASLRDLPRFKQILDSITYSRQQRSLPKDKK